MKIKEIERKRKTKKLISVLNLNRLISDGWLASPSIIPLHSFSLQVAVSRPKKIHTSIHYPVG
jgi:hypothetical protein